MACALQKETRLFKVMRFIYILLLASLQLSRADDAAVGRWEGSVQIPGRELPLIVDLAQEKGGAWIGSVIIPGMEVKGAPITEIARKDAELSFTLKNALATPGASPAAFKGQIAANGALSGNFLQAGNSAPFTLQKTGPPQVEVPPRSTTITKELEGEWKGEYTLFGYARQVTLKLTNRPEQGGAADFVIVGKKINNLSVDLVTQENDLVTIDSHEAGMSYEGRLQKDEIKGALLQGPLETPLNLKRTK